MSKQVQPTARRAWTDVAERDGPLQSARSSQYRRPTVIYVRGSHGRKSRLYVVPGYNTTAKHSSVDGPRDGTTGELPVGASNARIPNAFVAPESRTSI